jgi:hypothetical protein
MHHLRVPQWVTVVLVMVLPAMKVVSVLIALHVVVSATTVSAICRIICAKAYDRLGASLLQKVEYAMLSDGSLQFRQYGIHNAMSTFSTTFHWCT